MRIHSKVIGCLRFFAVMLAAVSQSWVVADPNSVVLFETGFERFEGYDPQLDLIGQSGWVGEGSGGNGLIADPVSGFAGQVAYIGYNAPTNQVSTLNVWHPLGLSPVTTDLPVVRFNVSMQIQDSTAAAPFFDDFRWSVYGVDGHRFFTLDFDNDAQRVFYLLDESVSPAAAFHDTHYTFRDGMPYDLVITMDLAKNLWNASVNGAVIVNGQPMTTSTNTLSLGDIDAVWVVRSPAHPGDNFMIFDDYRVEITPLTAIPAQLELIGFNRISGAFEVQVWGEPGVFYTLEATSDFKTWTSVAKGMGAPHDGGVRLADGTASRLARRFYRAVSQ